MKKLNQKGSHLLAILLMFAVVGIIGFIGLSVARKDTPKSSTPAAGTSTVSSSSAKTAAIVRWMQTADGYQAESTPPECADPIVQQFPADITQATSVLYPGQTRGGNYKPHGGLRFDKAANNNVSVKAPFDGEIIDGSTYLPEGTANDVQYTFDVMNSCGMMYRVGHLLTLSDQLAEIAKAFPAPQKGDSRTTVVSPPVQIKAGTVLATAVGTSSDKNVFFDWGVYDWRKANTISSDSTWLSNSAHNNSLAKHAICWFDQLSAKDEATIRALPAGDPTSGKTSDYCK